MKKLVISLAVVAAMGSAGSAMAGEWFGGVGAYKSNDKYSLGYKSEPVWTKTFDSSRVDLNMEYEFSQWRAGSRYDNLGNNDKMLQAAVTPMFNWHLNDKVYLQAGLGLSYFSENRFADKEFGSRLNFGSNLGVGYNFTPNTSVTYRISHYSNAGIKNPNPGIEIQQVILSHKF